MVILDEKNPLRYFFRGMMLYGLTAENAWEFFRLHPEFTVYEFFAKCKIMHSFDEFDCKGRLIYAGDIVKVIKKDHILLGNRFVVRWSKKTYKFEPFDILIDSGKDCEIIGNVCENPRIRVFRRDYVGIWVSLPL